MDYGVKPERLLMLPEIVWRPRPMPMVSGNCEARPRARYLYSGTRNGLTGREAEAAPGRGHTYGYGGGREGEGLPRGAEGCGWARDGHACKGGGGAMRRAGGG
jgi:hypothetical protein